MLPILFQFMMVTLNVIVTVIVTATSTAVQVNALPITSNPIESTAENLAWQAWIMMSPHQQNLEKSRKVTPKSIFILPNRVQIPAPVLTPDAQQWAVDPGSGGGGLYTAIECPPGQRQYESRCIPTLDIDREKLLLEELQTLLLQQDGLSNGGGDNNNNNDYDYDYNYEDAVGIVNSSAPMPVRSNSETSSSAAPPIRDNFDDVVQVPNDDSPLKFNIFKAKYPTSPEINESNRSHAVGPKSITNISNSTQAEISTTKDQSTNEPKMTLPLDSPSGNITMSSNTSTLLDRNSSHYPMTDIDTIILPAASTYDHSQRVSVFSNESALKFIATPLDHKNEENDDGDVATPMKWMTLNITDLLRLDSLLPLGDYPQATIEAETSTIKTTRSTETSSTTEAALLPTVSTATMSSAKSSTPTGKVTSATPTLPAGAATNVTPTRLTSFITHTTDKQSILPTKITITSNKSESVKPGKIVYENKQEVQQKNETGKEENEGEDTFDIKHQTNATDQQITQSASVTVRETATKTTDVPVSSLATLRTSQPLPSVSATTVNNFQPDKSISDEQRQDQHQTAAANVVELQDFVDLMKGQEQKSKVKPVEKQTDSRKHNGNDFYHELLSTVESVLQETNTQQQHTRSDAVDNLGHDDQFNYQSSKYMKPSSSEQEEFDERRKLEINVKLPLQQQIEKKATGEITTIISTVQTETETETTLSAIGSATELRTINDDVPPVKRREENVMQTKLQNAKPTKPPAATITLTATTINKDPTEISTAEDSNKLATTTVILPPSEIPTENLENVEYDESRTPTIQDAEALRILATVTTIEIEAATTNLFTGTLANTTTRTSETTPIAANTLSVSSKNCTSAINLKDDTKKLARTSTTSSAKRINTKTKSDKMRQFIKAEAKATTATTTVMNSSDSEATAIPRTTVTFSPHHVQSFSPTTPSTRATPLQPNTKPIKAETTTAAASTDTNSSIYWWVPIDWRLDRPTDTANLSSNSTSATSRRHENSISNTKSSINPSENQTKSLLLRFWSAFPGHQTKIKE